MNKNIIQLYGFTQSPHNNSYIIVIKYAKDGCLKENLSNIVKDKWITKLKKLYQIISGLNVIHQQKLVHCNFHHGNILHEQNNLLISNFRLCKPKENSQYDYEKKNTYKILPFLAPEVLRGKPYSLASDVYSFSIIMWEFTSGIPPYNDKAYDFQLGQSICKGKRPEIIKNTPKCYIDLMKKCWDDDPSKRPNPSDISNIIKNWCKILDNKLVNDDIMSEFRKAEEQINSSTRSTYQNITSYFSK